MHKFCDNDEVKKPLRSKSEFICCPASLTTARVLFVFQNKLTFEQGPGTKLFAKGEWFGKLSVCEKGNSGNYSVFGARLGAGKQLCKNVSL